MVDILISLILLITSKCICPLKHHIVHLKYMPLFIVNKAGENLREEKEYNVAR